MLPFIAVKGSEPLSLEMELTRARLEELIGPMIRSTLEPIEIALKDAKLDRSQITDVVLVGGSSRLTLVQSLIAEQFKKEPRRGVHPDEAIALGAAVQAGLKQGTIKADRGIMITDVCPYTLGVEVSAQAGRELVKGLFSPIIPRNSTVPVSRTETYLTTSDNQRAVEIRVYQGQDRLVKNNTFLDAYSVEGVPPGPAGNEKVAVTFTYDINGILNVKTRVVSTGKEAVLTVESTSGRMSDEERDAKKERVEKDWGKSATPGATPASAPPAATAPSRATIDPGARALLDKARAKAATARPSDKARLDELVQRFDQALSKGDAAEVSRLDAQLTDLLFDLE
jgi:molecular chaperone DnaK